MKPSKPKIVVIGAGIVGASIAYHLARRGAAVTLIDKDRPAADVTSKAFAWINVAHGLPEPYAQLRRLAVQEHHRLERELGQALRIDWCGALTWHRDPADTMRFVREHAAWGYDIRLVERDEIAALEPNLIAPPDCAAYAASEGALDPTAATEALVRAAARAGAEIRLATAVIGLDTNGRGITGIRTNGGALHPDAVVMAAGTATGSLCRQIGVVVPVDASPALLLRFRAPGKLVNSVISNPDFEIRQGFDGRLLGAEDFSAGSDPDVLARGALALIKDGLHGADAVELESAEVGTRPIPADGCPIVGFSSEVDGLYIAAMHAGVTMAPAIGRFAATEILDGVEVKALDSCRPGRFAAVSPASGG